MLRMLKSSDIHVGMRVITEQLDNITDKYIYLKDTEMVPDENGIPVYIEGTVAFIGNAEEKDRYMQEHKDEYGHQLLVANSICDGECSVNSLHENYLMSVMSPRQTFNVQCTFYINGEFKAVSGKLDTGCTKTLISADAIYSLYNVQEMKKRDILDVLRNGGEFSHGFGVETDISKYVPPKTLDEAMNDKTLRFEKPVQDLRINGYRIGDINVRIGYNTSKKVLMGMDVIKRLNSFIGPYNGKLYFLATHSNIVKTADLFEKIMQEVSRLSIDEDKYLDLDGEYDLNDEQAAEAAYINKLLKSNLNRG